MGPTVTTLDERSDAELISAVRAGDVAAYGELFARHVEAARRLGRQLVPGPDVDDLVSESFTKVLSVLQRGGGPDLAFRAYLLTAVRRVHVDRIRATARLHTTDDLTPFDPGVPFRDTAVEGFESAAAARAFASLPERWQLVLWHTEVEGQKPAEVAPLLAMSPNAVSALAYRAREGLRQAYLSMHGAASGDGACERTRAELGAYVRGGLSRRDAARVEEHLERCRRCTALYLELTEVNSNLRAVLAPLLLGVAATAYVASSGVAVGGLGALLGRLRDLALTHGSTAAIAGVASAAVVAGAVLTVHQGPGRDPGAEGSPAITASPAPSSTSRAPAAADAVRDRPVRRTEAPPSARSAPAATRSPAPAAADSPAAGAQPPATAAAAPSSPQPSSPVTAPASPAATPARPSSAPPAGQSPTPALVDLAAHVSAGPDGVEVGLGLDLAGVAIVPDSRVGVPLPSVG
ncbi:sigma-70 family RNA polymerase sigma factor [Nocardioides sp. URHA0020]|uniref:sigma-70 family RNA polymerase sigma factor n=1 Tax=Nocardioides sp. URHA0020 TaxID=1380392 RepID=UPI000686D7BE|nr:sigma-70 family RNA polymerase sigma factor [Nocardioides sp. URHA0020]